MLKLILGKKGTGKTKLIVEKANESARACDGSVIFIEKDKISTYRLSHKIRLADVVPYKINTYDELYGFVCGMIVSNYDIKEVYVDAVTRIGGRNMDNLIKFLGQIAKLAEEKEIDIILSVSYDKSELPNGIPIKYSEGGVYYAK